MTSEARPIVRMTHRFDASAERVFDARAGGRFVWVG